MKVLNFFKPKNITLWFHRPTSVISTERKENRSYE